MSYNPTNPNGQATSANSSPVVIASDQSTVSTDHAKTAGTTTSVNNGTTDAGTQRVTLSSDSTGQVIARGNVASGAADSGNPVKVGGVFNSSAPTLTTGQRADLQLDTSGNLKVTSTPSGTQTVSGTVAATQSGTWSVQPGNTANTTPWLATINQGGNSATVTASNALKVDGSAVTQPVSGTVTANAGTGTFAVNVSQMGGSAVTTSNGTAAGSQRVTLASDSTGQVALASGSTVGLATGANTIGNVGVNAGTNAIGTVNLSPTTSGGWSVSSQTALQATATVSGSAGKFGGYMFGNTNNAVAYIQVFDTTGAVTLGTTTPTFVVPIPAGASANIEFTNGIAMTSGVKIAATTTATGATTVATALTGFVLYK